MLNMDDWSCHKIKTNQSGLHTKDFTMSQRMQQSSVGSRICGLLPIRASETKQIYHSRIPDTWYKFKSPVGK